MSRTASPSSGKRYGVAAVCRVWRVGRATVYRHRLPARPAPPRRPGPAGPIADPDLVEAIRRVLHDSSFHGEGHWKVRARLRIAGTRTSKRRVLRLLRAVHREPDGEPARRVTHALASAKRAPRAIRAAARRAGLTAIGGGTPRLSAMRSAPGRSISGPARPEPMQSRAASQHAAPSIVVGALAA